MASSPSRPPRPSGIVFPSPVVMLTIVAVAMAAVAFFATRGDGPSEREVATPVRDNTSASASASPTDAAKTKTPEPKPKPKPIQRDAVYVEVYNNSGITGLAGRVATQATDVGWDVVGADNWYGTIPASTVYFPPRLARAAKQLSLDLGVGRTAPAVGAMKLDRLTVILTGEI